jgi:hypothetical protein
VDTDLARIIQEPIPMHYRCTDLFDLKEHSSNKHQVAFANLINNPHCDALLNLGILSGLLSFILYSCWLNSSPISGKVLHLPTSYLQQSEVPTSWRAKLHRQDWYMRMGPNRRIQWCWAELCGIMGLSCFGLHGLK